MYVLEEKNDTRSILTTYRTTTGVTVCLPRRESFRDGRNTHSFFQFGGTNRQKRDVCVDAAFWLQYRDGGNGTHPFFQFWVRNRKKEMYGFDAQHGGI
mmetsp:Transcript_25745/g.26145  ORF Transcript_25745/g.26145 Transcript_25745/m.26145 type:complete len:98 (-) Transcript_25745:540-833(-)